MIYLIYPTYRPNTAPSNRALAFLRLIDKVDVPVIALFVAPDIQRSKISEVYRNIKLEYCWERYHIDWPVLRLFVYYLTILKLISRFKKGDKVYVYGLYDALVPIANKKNIQVYWEETECPDVMLSILKIKPSLKKLTTTWKNLSGLFVISHALKNYFIEKGVDSDKIHVINMTVDTDRFLGIEKKNKDEDYIAYCGTVSNNKDGVDVLIKSFAIVAKSHPSIKLYILGGFISNNDAQQNIDLIKELGLETRIVLKGTIAAKDMPQVLKDARGLVLARPDNVQAKYGFPTKLGEYLMTENPVVVTSVGDIPMFLEDGKNALIAPPDNPKAFAEKILWLLSHPDESKIIGINGRDVALKHFNSSIECRKMVDILLK